MSHEADEDATKAPTHAQRSRIVPMAIAGLTALIFLAGAAMYSRAASQTNRVALDAEPKGVTVAEARPLRYRAQRRYVGTLEPWLLARIGPELVSGYVATVLVRPGASVKRGEVLATLDCRNASASSNTVALQARALEARQRAVASEAARVRGLLVGGFVSANEAEQKSAESDAQKAHLLALRSQLSAKALEVDDCVLRAPFDGEVSARTADPGAFVRPGSAIVTLVDRSTIRLTGDVPEIDFTFVAPETPARIHLVATAKDLEHRIARRSPSADAGTRTVHFEIDLDDPSRTIPVGTTAEITVDVGEPKDVLAVPLTAAKIRGKKASLFLVEGGAVRSLVAEVVGESGGELYLAPTFPAGAKVVTEGRGSLKDGDRVRSGVQTARTAGTTKRPE